MTSKVWHALSDSLEGWKTHPSTYAIEGFEARIPGVAIRHRLAVENACGRCTENMRIEQTEDGYIRLTCPHGHMHEMRAAAG